MIKKYTCQCKRCDGSGNYDRGTCFECKGSGHKKGSLYVNDLQIRAQGNTDNKDEEVCLYGFSVEFSQVFKVEIIDAQNMLNTLSKIDKEMTKQYDTWGNPAKGDFGNYLVRVNDQAGYFQWRNESKADGLAGKHDHTLTFLQYAHYLQTSNMIALLS